MSKEGAGQEPMAMVALPPGKNCGARSSKASLLCDASTCNSEPFREHDRIQRKILFSVLRNGKWCNLTR